MQRFINPDGTLKELPANNNGRSQASLKTSIEELLIPARSGNEQGRERRLQETAKLVDTTLFRAYMLARPSMAGPLFRLPNFCDADVVKEKLLETGRYNDLIDFFYGKGLHRQALELLQKFGQDSEGGDAPTALRGPQRTVAYLQNLPPKMIDLILEFAEWPLKVEPDLGMEVFIADTENAETLPRARVLDFLQKIDQKLAVQYLEHIINELNDITPEFHQRLIDIYLAGLKSEEFTGKRIKEEWEEKFLAFLRSSQRYELWNVIRQLPKDGKVSGETTTTRR